MSTVEQIAAAARKCCKTKDVPIGDGVMVTLRELTRQEQKALNARLFVTDKAGLPIAFDKDDKPAKDGEGWYHFKPDVDFRREWLAATMTPADAVNAVLGDDVPESLKKLLLDTARELSGLTTREAAGN